jgi:capsule polysaccharide export protein KpsC/LpsZ
LKASDDLIVREMTNWKQVLFHPDGVPNGEALLRVSEVIAVSSGIQSEAARTLPWCSNEDPVIRECKRRKTPLVSVR